MPRHTPVSEETIIGGCLRRPEATVLGQNRGTPLDIRRHSGMVIQDLNGVLPKGARTLPGRRVTLQHPIRRNCGSDRQVLMETKGLRGCGTQPLVLYTCLHVATAPPFAQ